MDLETENRIAAILMKEAAELRRQAEKDGVHVYLQQPNVRGRPNSRFLTATVLGVQQANRAVEVNEMWRVRQKELELDDRLRGKRRDDDNCRRVVKDNNKSHRNSTENEVIKDDNATSSCSSSKRVLETCRLKEDDGLKDEELQEFLHSRVKRGRGGIGSRMDETGPYLPPRLESNSDLQTGFDITRRRVIYGLDKPSSPKSYESSEEESVDRPRKSSSSKRKSSGKQHSKKHSSKSKSKKKKRKEKRSSGSGSGSISKHHR